MDEELPPGPNLTAVNATLDVLTEMGRINPIDAARVTALRSMAAALDANPSQAQLWREYRAALEGLTADDGDDGAIDKLLAEMRTPVRDT